ncbi:MAG: vitamin K epoxide reductase family protein [Candidatus Ancillula sp.]|jgi:uncharacterized membrane protein|nr:vitamin K epoxide reductase family protein [Candidatus Ancillula sp.]
MNVFSPIKESIKGIRHTKGYVGIVFLIFSLLAMLASFMLSIEALFEARNPGSRFSCDINAVLSCSTVAASDQAEILGKILPFFGDFTVPNAFLGMIFEAVFITIAVLLICGTKMPKWFMTASQIGNLCALIFAYWLFYQSSFVIGAMCPWCLLLMVSTTFQFFSQLHYNVLAQYLPFSEKFNNKLQSLIASGVELMIEIIVILIIVLIVVLKYGPRLIQG